MTSHALASTRASATTATELAERQVSIPSASIGKAVADRSRPGLPALEGWLDRGDFRDVVLEHVLDAGLERRRGRWAARAGAAHVQVDDAGLVVEAREQYVAAVLGHGRADAGVE